MLDDIWNFYSNKNIDKIIRSKSKVKENGFPSSNINNTNFQPVKKNFEIKDNSNSKHNLIKENKRIENSIDSISLNNHSQKKSFKETDKIKDKNVFSPISKNYEERETKNNSQNTNSDILKCLLSENNSKSNKKSFIKRGIIIIKTHID